MIKQPAWAFVSALLLIGFVFYVFERIAFLRIAERTSGTVVSLSARNGRCGGKHKHDCTEFSASVPFKTLAGQAALLTVGAGDVHGHNQSTIRADRRVGDRVPVVYDPSGPSKCYEDTLFGVWGGPLMVLMFQICTFISSLSQPKGNRREYGS